MRCLGWALAGVVSAGAAGMAGAAGVGAGARTMVRQLLRDRRFRSGFVVWEPVPDRKVVGGKLRPPGARGEPAWGLAQWATRHSLSGARPERLPSGAIRFGNAGKAVTLGKRGSEEADLAMAVDTRPEYEHPRKPGEPWIHFLAEQSIERPPTVAELKRLDFGLRARLRRSLHHKPPDYSPHVHAAQFQVFLTVQNRNRQSAGYGKLLWFGIPLYDDRARIPPSFTAPDAAGLFIYTPSGDNYMSESLHDGKWVTVKRDVLPLIRDALRLAWERGFLTESRDPADYRVAALNVGWEVPGMFEVEMQVCDLSLEAVTSQIMFR